MFSSIQMAYSLPISRHYIALFSHAQAICIILEIINPYELTMQPTHDATVINHLFLGPLRSDTIILPDRRVYSGLLGGPLAYAASGAGIWSLDHIGLVSRIGNNYPQPLLDQLASPGWNIQGIHILPDPHPFLGFYFVQDGVDYREAEPLHEYSALDMPCPPELMDFSSPCLGEEDTSNLPAVALRPVDIPDPFQFARSAFIGSCHLTSQITLMVALRRLGVSTIVLSPSERIMSPQYLRDFRILLQDVDVLFVREIFIRNLFREDTRDIHQIAEILSSFGAKFVIIQKALGGYSVYDSDAKRHRYIPAYPVKERNPIGCGDAFCGGFLANWQSSYDPIESAMHGCISASLSLEGMGAMFSLERSPLLANARLQSLRNLLPRNGSEFHNSK
jgi:hypothetical protein